MKPARARQFVILVLLLLLLDAPFVPHSATAGSDDTPGVRGSLYESPSYGWTIIVDRDIWSVEEATSADGIDTLTLNAWEDDDLVAIMLFQTTPGDAGDVRACVADAGDRLDRTWPDARIEPAVDNEGNVIFEEFNTDHWIAAYVIDNDIVVEIDCWTVPRTDGVLLVMAITDAGVYLRDQEAWATGIITSEDRLRESYSDPGGKRNGQRRTRRAPVVGVLEFSGGLCATWVMGHEFPRDELGLDLSGEATPPDDPLPDGQAYVLDTGWVGNADAIASYLDLNSFVARFPDDVEGASRRAYAPSHFAWLTGVDKAAGPVIMLTPGDLVAYLLWYIVDIPSGDHEAWLSVTYDPITGGTADAGYTHAISHYGLSDCGGAGGGRPRVRLGN